MHCSVICCGLFDSVESVRICNVMTGIFDGVRCHGGLGCHVCDDHCHDAIQSDIVLLTAGAVDRYVSRVRKTVCVF